MMVHSSAVGMVKSAYSPAGISLPPSVTAGRGELYFFLLRRPQAARQERSREKGKYGKEKRRKT